MKVLSENKNAEQKNSALSECKKIQPSQTIVHAQLEMTTPGDADEVEANAMADAIVGGGKIRRQISNGTNGSGIAVSAAMENQLAQTQGGGRSMPDGLRNMMENGFGRDFSNVRIHTDSQAVAMSENLSAKAFTLGNDIYFNKGQFSPNTTSGQHLIAHELTHVVQGNGKVGRKPFGALEDSARENGRKNDYMEAVKRGYEELKSHGVLFAINDEVFEISSQFLIASREYIAEHKLSSDTIKWIENIEKKVGRLNKLSHGFVVLNNALTIAQVCEIIYRAKHMDKYASAKEKGDLLIDTSILIISAVGGVPGAIFVIGYKELYETAMNYIENHPGEIKRGILHFFNIDPDFDFFINPMEYLQ